MKLACRFRWHDWSSWGVPERRRVNSVYTRFRSRQTRQCLSCGKTQYRWIPGSGDDTPQTIVHESIVHAKTAPEK